MHTETPFSEAALPGPQSQEAAPTPLDKRVIQERNRIAVLRWLYRFGWLTSRMVASLVWPEAAQGIVMTRRTLKLMVEEKFVIARQLTKGGAAYLLAAKGARFLNEREGLDAQSGNALSLGNPVHRACSNWYLIRALQNGLNVVTEHEIATGRGPVRVFSGKAADGLVIGEDGQCIWIECENAQKSPGERQKTVGLVRACIGGERQVELAPGLHLARVAIVATNERALRWMASSFQEAYRVGLISEGQVAEVDACLMPVSESLVCGEVIEGNMWWHVLLPSLAR